MADYQASHATVRRAAHHLGPGVLDIGLNGKVGIIQQLRNGDSFQSGIIGLKRDVVGSIGQGVKLKVVVDQLESELSAISVTG